MNPPASVQKARIFPAAEKGWCLEKGGSVLIGDSIASLSDEIEAQWDVELLLPSDALIFERLVLPPAPAEDLRAMAQLQLEKLLPYPIEECVFDLEELDAKEDGVALLAVVLPLARISQFAEPVRGAELALTAVGLMAQQTARAMEGEGVSMALWREQGVPLVLFSKNGKLLSVEPLSEAAPTESPDAAAEEWSRILLAAELAGVLDGPVNRVFLGDAGWREVAQRVLPQAAVLEQPLKPAPGVSGNWLPEAWRREGMERHKRARLVGRLQWAGLAYLMLLMLGFLWLALEKSRIARIERELSELKPKVELVAARKARWKALEPAVEPSRYFIEVLHQAARAIGPADIKITEFQMAPREFSFSGEASSLAEAIEYIGRLKKEPVLEAFKLESPNPNILPNERAQFRVTAKGETKGGAKK